MKTKVLFALTLLLLLGSSEARRGHRHKHKNKNKNKNKNKIHGTVNALKNATLTDCTGECTTDNFPLCLGSCTAHIQGLGNVAHNHHHHFGDISACTGNCSDTTFPICDGECRVTVNASAVMPPDMHPRPPMDLKMDLTDCTGDCTSTNFPHCQGTCVATGSSTLPLFGQLGRKLLRRGHGHGAPFEGLLGDHMGDRPTPSNCTGDCTPESWPLCEGTCVLTADFTAEDRPKPFAVSGCDGDCTDTNFPMCTGSCLVAGNTTLPFHGDKPNGGEGFLHGAVDLKSCDGDCTQQLFPFCSGSCSIVINTTALLPPMP